MRSYKQYRYWLVEQTTDPHIKDYGNTKQFSRIK